MLDEDGYPTEEALKRIEEWPHTDIAGLLAFVKRLWRYPNFWCEQGERLCISTGGWSGNEDLIRAMESNRILWALCWHQSTRGGHYEFDVSRIDQMAGSPAQ